MKLITFVVLTMSMLTSHAANVHWATLTVEDWGDSYCVFEYGSGIPYFYVSIFHDALADRYTLSFKPPEAPLLVGSANPYRPNMYVYENMVFAKEGDIVSSATTRFLDDSKYAVHYGIDDNRYFFGEISDVVPLTYIYLSYICSDDPVGYKENQHYYYGWVGLAVDNEGTLYPYGAVDYDGGPMIVGGGAWEGNIPEPSSGILLLLGAAALGLRRRLWKYF